MTDICLKQYLSYAVYLISFEKIGNLLGCDGEVWVDKLLVVCVCVCLGGTSTISPVPTQQQ